MTAKKKEKAEKDEFENIADTLGCDTSDDALDNAFENLEIEAEPEENKPEK